MAATCLGLVPGPVNAAVRFLAPHSNGLDFGLGFYTDTDERVMEAAVTLTPHPVLDVGVRGLRAKSRDAAAIRMLAISPSIRFTPVRPGADYPVGWSFEGAYVMAGFDADTLDAQGLEVTGSSVMVGTTVFGRVDSQHGMFLVPSLSLRYVRATVDAEDAQGAIASTSDDEVFFVTATGFAFPSSTGKVFYLEPAIHFGERDTVLNISFGMSLAAFNVPSR